jgi:hypothetical protein
VFGWVPTLIRIAKTGLFNLGNMTPLEAAGEANLYEAFTILNYQSADNQYKNRLQEEAAKDRARKSKR